MARIATAFAVLGAAGLAACSTYDPYYSSTPNPNPPTAVAPAPVTVVPAAPVAVAPPAPAPVVAGNVPSLATYRAGLGTVESASLVNVAPPPAGASASAGASSATYPAYRLSVRMDDGSVQTIDQDNRAFMVGDRIEVTSSGRIVRR
jgi:hypothetical protein